MPKTITIDGLIIDETTAPTSYTGAVMIYGRNTGAREPYPYTLTETISLRGFQSRLPFRMSNDYLRDKIRVVTR